MKPFATFNYDDAAELFGPRIPKTGTAYYRFSGEREAQDYSSLRRRPASAVTATAFYNSDHWQSSRGFIGQLPPSTLKRAAQITNDIEAGFVSENVVQEVVETHTGGILGREPFWSFLKAETPSNRQATPDDRDTETGDTLTPWWNEREGLRELQKAVTTLLLEGGVVRRLFIPRGLLSGNGTYRASNLPDALKVIYFMNHTTDEAGVFVDELTQKRLGVYLFKEYEADGKSVKAHCAELSFLNDRGETICRVLKDKGEPESYGPYQLGGHLLVYQLDRRALITEQVQSNQRALNLAHTMMMRNVNMAGARERIITNAQPPLERQRVVTSATEPSTEKVVVAPWNTGAGAVNVPMGYPIYDDDGKVKGYTSPNVTIVEPSSVETFVQTGDHYRQAIYSQCHQRHVLIVDKADTSGRAREVARREFERSLKETKIVVDASGRWQLEAALRLAAQIAGSTSKYLRLRADFNCLIDAGEPDPEKQKVVLELRKPGGLNNRPLISDETARNWIGVEDATAELGRIEAEEKTQTAAELPPSKSPEELAVDAQPDVGMIG